MKIYDAVIIGAGIAGLATALRLNKRGMRVLVLEKNAYVGGKMNQYKEKGYRWDTGPSLFTMPSLVNELYGLYQKNPADYYTYQQEDEACRYFFEDGTTVNFYTDRKALTEEIARQLSVDKKRINSYLEKSAEKYEAVGALFLEYAIHKPSSLPWKKVLSRTPQFLSANLLTSLHQYNKKTLQHPKLVQIFDRYATYNGSNPYEASGVLSMIPHLEQNIGTFFPTNGIRSIVDGLYKLALEEGIDILLGQTVKQCIPEKEGYEVYTDKPYYAKRLICAIDCLTFYKHILRDATLYQRYKKQERSSSALIYYWGMAKQFPKLGLHNIFFSIDYQREFEQIFKEKVVPKDATIYVHISSKSNPKDAPANGENWFVMINTPAGASIGTEEKAAIKALIIKRLERLLKTSIEPFIEVERVWTPKGIEWDTGAYQGALYGAASNAKMAALTRHPNFSKKYKDLYFCGGTVHPGGGIPLSIQSAKIVEKLIINEPRT